jgi:hypothetical protein
MKKLITGFVPPTHSGQLLHSNQMTTCNEKPYELHLLWGPNGYFRLNIHSESDMFRLLFHTDLRKIPVSFTYDRQTRIARVYNGAQNYSEIEAITLELQMSKKRFWHKKP